MKKFAQFIILPFFVLSLNTGFTQTYKTLPDSNALWLIRDTWSPGPGQISYNHFFIRTDSIYNDTLINSTVYIKLFEELCNQTGQMGYLGAFRHDLSGKVFYCPKDSVEELLMQDYSANEGDTIFGVSILVGGLYFPFTEYDMAVDSVRYYYNGIDSVKVIFVHCSYDSFIWIEGMGSTGGGTFNLSYGLNGYDVRCFSHADTIYFDFYSFWVNKIPRISVPGTCYDYDCNPNISVEEHIIYRMNIYPNPVSDILYIENDMPEEPTLITMTDITGRLVYQCSFSNSIDVSHLPKGMYVLSVHTNARQFVSKVIVQ